MTAPKRIGIAIVEHAGRYLVGVRGPDVPLAGFAEFPGGKCLPDESGTDCAVRECLEETGLAVTPQQALDRLEFEYPHGRVDLHFVLCQPVRPADVCEEHHGFHWASLDELSAMNFPEANASVIKLLAALNNGSSTGHSKPEAVSAPPWAWLVGSLIATTGLCLAAAHAPHRIRLIGLFFLAFGLIIGWAVVRLATMLETHPSKWMLGLVAAVLSLGGLIGCTWETFRLEQAQLAKSPKDEMALRLMESMKSQPNLDEAIPLKPSTLTEFRQFLSRRIRQLGDWSSPWPELFWVTELVVSASASAWLATRLSRSSAGRTAGAR